jgi:hypothetical protein
MSNPNPFHRTRIGKSLLPLLLGGLGIALIWNPYQQVGAQTPARAESDKTSPIAMNPAKGRDPLETYQAFLSPQQEGGEESETPEIIPANLRSSAPSLERNKRPDRGHAVIEFNAELSKATVHLAVTNVNVNDINMLHLHCGRPGQLGPILVDFALIGDLNTYLSDAQLTLEITNEDIVAVTDHGDHSLFSAFTKGCPIIPAIPNDRVKTIAGMAAIARQGELYFNLHTKAQTYFGDIRGQFLPVPSK